MKKILVILLFTFAVGCSKNSHKNQECYKCTFGLSAAGQQVPPRTICLSEGQKIDDYHFMDDYGNDLVSYCTKK